MRSNFIQQVNKVQGGELPFAELARLLPRVADREELVAVETVQLPLTWTFRIIFSQLLNWEGDFWSNGQRSQ